MNKYIVPILITFFCLIYLTYLITYLNVSKSYEEQIQAYKYNMTEMEQEISELRNTLYNCEK